jgi:nitrite reductase/ring-hydroxylating ferredoxin subunit
MTAAGTRPRAAAGTVLCRLDAIEDGAARGFTLDDAGGRPVDLLVARDGAAVHGYLNACPHVGTPLDWVPDRFMAPDGEHLACATHGALFRVSDGYCVAGAVRRRPADAGAGAGDRRRGGAGRGRRRALTKTPFRHAGRGRSLSRGWRWRGGTAPGWRSSAG